MTAGAPGPLLRPYRANFAFVLVAIAEAVLIGAILWGIFALERATEQRDAERETLTAIDAALIALLDAESGQRGYVISGEDAFLNSYGDARNQLTLVMADLDTLLRDDPSLSAGLSLLTPQLDALFSAMDGAVATRRLDPANAAAAQAMLGEGQQLMDGVRGRIASMRAIESSRLRDRADAADSISRFIGITSVTLAVATLALVAWLFVILRWRQEARVAVQAKEEFVGFVSHELRGPIAVVAGNARLMTGEDVASEEKARAVEEITASAERIQDTIDTLLSLAHVDAGAEIEVEPILVHRVMEHVAAIHHERFPETHVELGFTGDLAPAMGNRQAVEQILINLLSNAAKYGDTGQPIELTAQQAGHEIVVAVTNGGPRHNPEDFQHVFEPFFRGSSSPTAAPGIGLGLTVCHRLVTAQGGRMSATARDEGGASFTFTLPIARMAGEEAVAAGH